MSLLLAQKERARHGPHRGLLERMDLGFHGPPPWLSLLGRLSKGPAPARSHGGRGTHRRPGRVPGQDPGKALQASGLCGPSPSELVTMGFARWTFAWLSPSCRARRQGGEEEGRERQK